MVKRILIIAPVVGVLIVGATGYAIGLYGFERHSGLFAPVWSKSGDAVYALRRTTGGFVWGLGWEFFSPPAYSYVTSDRFELLKISEAGKTPEVLARWTGSPVVGRVTRHYRGRIFNYLSARLEPSEQGLQVRLRMSIPRVPRSEIWGIDATWAAGRSFAPQWAPNISGGLSRPEAVLNAGREVITVPGPEGFDAGVLVVRADGSKSVLLKESSFDGLYPDEVPLKIVQERSNRKQIEKIREFRRVQSELVARYMAEGAANEGQAILRAYDEMERLGYLPQSPRIVATPIDTPPDDLTVFDIPDLYIRSGLFQDIAKAVEQPGTAVKSDVGSYLKYAEDDLGPRLRAFRESGGDRFAVRIGGKLFRIEMVHPKTGR